jgi:hypothetical protein
MAAVSVKTSAVSVSERSSVGDDWTEVGTSVGLTSTTLRLHPIKARIKFEDPSPLLGLAVK